MHRVDRFIISFSKSINLFEWKNARRVEKYLICSDHYKIALGCGDLDQQIVTAKQVLAEQRNELLNFIRTNYVEADIEGIERKSAKFANDYFRPYYDTLTEIYGDEVGIL